MDEKQQKFDTLVLLIGSNPLPNYVISKYYLQKGNMTAQNLNILFFYSEKTLDIADRLKILLIKKFEMDNARIEKYPLRDINRVNQIQLDVKASFVGLKGKNIHVNYTGGTKSMSVNIYQEFEQNRGKFKELSFSYLDGRSYKIVFDKPNDSISNIFTKVDVSFEELHKLHGLVEKNKRETMILSWEPAVNKIIDLHKTEMLKQDFIKMRKKFHINIQPNEDEIAKKNKIVEKVNEINKHLQNETYSELLLELLRLIPQKNSFLTNTTEKLLVPTSNMSCDDYYNRLEMFKFFSGHWLEYYTYITLHKIKNEYTNVENTIRKDNIIINMNWKLKNKESSVCFELDVSTIVGYVLLAISCTTNASVKECKLKAFEVIHRAKQIGGDEAFSLLITGLNEKKTISLRDDINNDMYFETRFKVLGIDDIKNKDIFKNRIKDHFFSRLEELT